MDVSVAIEFLTKYFSDGASYSTVNTARSALSLFLSFDGKNTIGSHPLVCRLLRGVGKARPPQPRYDFTWNPDIVLNYIKTMWPLESLTLFDLSIRTATLLSLCTAHRMQTLASIRVSEIEILDSKIQIKIVDRIKTSRPGSTQPLLVLPRLLEEQEVCPVTSILFYINLTKTLRPETVAQLFISCSKPHKAVCSQTLSRWVKTVLERSGIDINKYKSHSVRHSATSAAKRNGITLDSIRSHAGWSSRSNVFSRFYDRPLDTSTDFANAILNSKK